MTAPSMPDPSNMDSAQEEMAKAEPGGQAREPASSASDADAELIAAVRSGDARAYGLLYERHASAARRLARQFVTAPADVDDVVAETFSRVLQAIRRGNGPVGAFRPYLLTALRRIAIDLVNGQRRQIPTEDADLPDPGEDFVDPVVADLERSLIARAFWSLPERWSAVLWYTEVEQASPAEVGVLLGLSANGVSVLRRRAREGLKLAYLQSHLAGRVSGDCTATTGKLGRYVRGRLPRRQAREVELHLARCTACAAAQADLAGVNDGLRGLLAPALLGAAATDYLASAAHATPKIGRIGRIGVRPAIHHAGEMITRHPVAAAATAVAVSIAVPGLYLLHPAREHPAAAPVLRLSHHGGNRTGRRPPGARPGARSTQPAAPSVSPTPSATRTAPSKPASPPVVPTSPGSPTTSPTSPPSTSPTPSPTPGPTTSATARLSVSVQVNGLLNLGVTVLVTVAVSDPGTAATGPVTANITLPSGIAVLGLVGSSSWSCSATSSGQTCTRGAIGAGAGSSVAFSVLVVNLTGCGNPVAATAISGSLSATGTSAAKVSCGPT